MRAPLPGGAGRRGDLQDGGVMAKPNSPSLDAFHAVLRRTPASTLSISVSSRGTVSFAASPAGWEFRPPAPLPAVW